MTTAPHWLDELDSFVLGQVIAVAFTGIAFLTFGSVAR